METWLPIVVEGVATIIQQWQAADADTQAQIQARVLTALRDMVADRDATAASHDARTAATVATLDALAAKIAAPKS